jgi:ribosomal protein S18 acetylase RimI-like enzyme
MLIYLRKLVELFIEKIKELDGDEVVLETESVNLPALRLYESNSKKFH